MEVFLVLTGIAITCAGLLKPALRARWSLPVLRRWSVTPADFVLFLLVAIGSGLAMQILSINLLKHSGLPPTTQLVMIAGAFQLGLLGGLGIFYWFGGKREAPPDEGRSSIFKSGLVTFLIALPVVAIAAVAWQSLLAAMGLPVEKQELMDLFVNARSPFQRGGLIVLAAIVAPVTEELIFRAGLFRFLRTRVPGLLALSAPAILFGALHVEWTTLKGLAAFVPLVALGIVFSLAYERTGRIGTTMVAHALFNLNTIVLMLAGVNV